MKIIANDYDSKDIMKMLRESTDLKQGEFANAINKSRRTVQSYENGTRAYSFNTFMEVAEKYGFRVTIEKM